MASGKARPRASPMYSLSLVMTGLSVSTASAGHGRHAATTIAQAACINTLRRLRPLPLRGADPLVTRSLVMRIPFTACSAIGARACLSLVHWRGNLPKKLAKLQRGTSDNDLDDLPSSTLASRQNRLHKDLTTLGNCINMLTHAYSFKGPPCYAAVPAKHRNYRLGASGHTHQGPGTFQ